MSSARDVRAKRPAAVPGNPGWPRSAQLGIGSILLVEECTDRLAPLLGLLEQEEVAAVDDLKPCTGNAAGEDRAVALWYQRVA
jgi:hypothetical protein